MQYLLVLLLLLFVPRALYAGTVTIDFGAAETITTTTAQEAKLNEALTRLNAARAAQTPSLPAVTLEQYIKQVLVSTVADWIKQERQSQASEACTRYQSLTTTQKNQIQSALDGKSPCLD